MKRLFATAPWLLVVAVSIAGSRDPKPDPGTYVDRRAGFSMKLPGFECPEPDRQGIRCMFYAPVEDGFAATVNVMSQPGGKSAEDYLAETKSGIATMGFKLVTAKQHTVGETPAVTMEYTGTQSNRELRFRALAVIGDERVWLVTCTALDEIFDDYRAGFERTLATFEPLAKKKTPSGESK